MNGYSNYRPMINDDKILWYLIIGLFLSLILNFELATSLPIYEYSKTKINDFGINGSLNIFLLLSTNL